MIFIKPHKFFNTFINKVRVNSSSVFSKWDDSKNFTELMLSENGILEGVAKDLSLKYYKEYWSLDAIYFEEKDTDHFKRDSYYAKNLSVIIEHENIPNTSNEEMNKLAIFSSPLKVLITYPSNESTANDLLECYSAILCDADIFNNFGTQVKIIVIFGSKTENITKWDLHAFNGEEFEKKRQVEINA